MLSILKIGTTQSTIVLDRNITDRLKFVACIMVAMSITAATPWPRVCRRRSYTRWWPQMAATLVSLSFSSCLVMG